MGSMNMYICKWEGEVDNRSLMLLADIDQSKRISDAVPATIQCAVLAGLTTAFQFISCSMNITKCNYTINSLLLHLQRFLFRRSRIRVNWQMQCNLIVLQISREDVKQQFVVWDYEFPLSVEYDWYQFLKCFVQ